MSVDASVTRATVEDELHEMRDYARTCRLGIVPRPDMLVVVVTLFAHDGEPFIMEISLDDYKEKPPLFEFIDPETGERGTRRAYPKTNDSLFHDNGPCICAPFNRKAYKEFAETGPHTDWKLGDWIRSKANGYDWCDITRLGDMIGLINTRLSRPETYKGRMG